MIGADRYGPRPRHRAAIAEAGLLALLAVMLLAKVASGVLVYYIHPRYTPLVLLGALALLLLAVTRACGWNVATVPTQRMPVYLALGFFILAGTVIPAQPLGAGALAERRMTTGNVAQSWTGQPESADTTTWTLKDWYLALNGNTAKWQGAAVRVEGFVSHDPAFGNDSLIVARYILTCCVVDAAPVGLPVIWRSSAAQAANGWVRVEGTISEITAGTQTYPVILATSVAPIEQPYQPYLYGR